MNNEFQKAKPILETLQQHGHDAYFVGGSVRDYLLKKEVNDVDIATSATPEEVMVIFPHHVPLGLQHGTVMVLVDGDSYEITTFRTEGTYEDFRRPSSVVFVRSLAEDLQRRDFTMNAIAMTADGEIIDLFHGQEAIEQQEIKTVGIASERFLEDALRMMRGVRFVSTLGFTIEQQTAEAMKEHAHLLEHVSIERITVEFEKMLMGPFVNVALEEFVHTNVFAALPHLGNDEEKIKHLFPLQITKLQGKEERWALLLFVLQVEDSISFLKKWKLPNKFINHVSTILQGVRSVEESGWNVHQLYELGKGNSMSVQRIRCTLHSQEMEEKVAAVQKEYEALPLQEDQPLDVTGTDLMTWLEKKGGPWIAKLLKELEQAVLEGELQNEKEAIRKWIDSCNHI